MIDQAYQFQTNSTYSFKFTILAAVKETYEHYKNAIVHQYGRNYWNETAKRQLFEYILGSTDRYNDFQDDLNNMRPESDWENNERDLLAKRICDVVIVRLEKLATLNPQNQKTGSIINSNGAVNMDQKNVLYAKF